MTDYKVHRSTTTKGIRSSAERRSGASEVRKVDPKSPEAAFIAAQLAEDERHKRKVSGEDQDRGPFIPAPWKTTNERDRKRHNKRAKLRRAKYRAEKRRAGRWGEDG